MTRRLSPSTKSGRPSPAACPPRYWITQGHGAGDLTAQVGEVAALAGYDLLPQQLDVIGVWSTYDSGGRWLHRRFGASITRQSGKSVSAIMRTLTLAAGCANIDAIRMGIRAQGDPLAAAQEYLGYWLPGETAAACLPPGSWEACEVDQSAVQTEGKLAFGVKFAPDGSAVALSAALAERDGPSYVELVDMASTSRGTAWLSRWLVARRDRCACVVIDGRSGAGALAQRLREGGMRRPGMVVECNPSGVQAAASMLLDEVKAKTLSHIASPALDESATRSVRRDVGRDGFGFGDGPNSTSIPIESASLALWGARTSKRDPRRRQRVSW